MAGAAVHGRGARSGATLLPIDSEHNAIFQALPRGFDGDLCPCRRAPHPAHRLRRAVPHARRWSSFAHGHAGPGVRASELGHGAQDLGGFGDHDEQGPGGHRGALAVQCAPPEHRGGDPPAERRALDGRIRGRLGASRSWAIPTCARRSRTRWPIPSASNPASTRLDLCRDRPRSASRRRTCERFPCLGLAYRGAARRAARAPVVLNAANEVAVANFLRGGAVVRPHSRPDRSGARAHAGRRGAIARRRAGGRRRRAARRRGMARHARDRAAVRSHAHGRIEAHPDEPALDPGRIRRRARRR